MPRRASGRKIRRSKDPEPRHRIMERIPTPRETSPYSLIQEHLRDDPWRLLVAVIMLNQTSARQARPVWEKFFERFPCPEELYSIPPDRALPELEDLLHPIGFYRRRAERLWIMTEQYLFDWDGKDPLDLHGIGKYGADSFNMFCRGYLVLDVQDKELRNYVRWATERRRAGEDLSGEPRAQHGGIPGTCQEPSQEEK